MRVGISHRCRLSLSAPLSRPPDSLIPERWGWETRDTHRDRTGSLPPPISVFQTSGAPRKSQSDGKPCVRRKNGRLPYSPACFFGGGGGFLIRSSRRRVGPWLEKSQKRNLPGLCLAEGDPFDGERLRRVARELKRAGGDLGAPSMLNPMFPGNVVKARNVQHGSWCLVHRLQDHDFTFLFFFLSSFLSCTRPRQSRFAEFIEPKIGRLKSYWGQMLYTYAAQGPRGPHMTTVKKEEKNPPGPSLAAKQLPH